MLMSATLFLSEMFMESAFISLLDEKCYHVSGLFEEEGIQSLARDALNVEKVKAAGGELSWPMRSGTH